MTPPAFLRDRREALFGAVMFWTILTTIFAWLPLVRIMGRPEGYQWSILGLSGDGLEGPFWIFLPLTAYAVALLFTAHRGPRTLFYPMLVLWHLAVTGVVVAGVVLGGPGATWEGQGLNFSIPLWLLIVPFALFTVFAAVWAVADRRAGGTRAPASWAWANSRRLALSLLLLVVALALFRAGTNYNWVTAVAIVVTVVHWILLAESFKAVRPPAKRDPWAADASSPRPLRRL